MTADVLIIGAGPTGLTMALELARRHVGVRIIDTATAPTTETRALGVQPRTLELFEKVKLADAAVARGVPVTEFNVFSEGKRFLHLDIHALETPHPYLVMLPQPDVETLLACRLAEYGVTVERGVELSTLAQSPDAVLVGLRRHGGKPEHTHVPWVIGCDGAHSTVRQQLGIPFVGTAFEENFAVADVRMNWTLPHDVFHSFLNRGRFVAFFPMPGGLHRLTIAYRPDQSPLGDVTFDELQTAVERCAPAGARVAEVTSTGRFRINQRKVARHSAGRVFLAGDAAHVHSVVGGQGMNTGIQDAFNLGWKLAAVVHGQAAREILDSYAAERSPVAHRLVKGTRRATRMTLLRSPIAAAARRHLAPHVTARPPVQRILARALTQLDVSYRDGTGGSIDTRPAIGDRFPAIDVLDDTKYTVLYSGSEPPGLRAVVEPHAELVEVRQNTASGYGAGLTLVRPDGYLALLNCTVRALRDHLDATLLPPAPGEHTAATG